jgi:hypothetical protein
LKANRSVVGRYGDFFDLLMSVVASDLRAGGFIPWVAIVETRRTAIAVLI